MFEIENNGISRVAHRWLFAIALLCSINAVLLFVVQSNAFRLYSMLLPWFGALLVDIGLFVIAIIKFTRIRMKNNDARIYISKHHNKIYNKLYPNSRFPSYTPPIAGIKFILGKYDDGTDIRLQAIKTGHILIIKLIFFPHFLVLVAWGINILIIKFK